MRILDRISGLVSKSTGLILLLTILLTALAFTRIVDPVTGEMRLEIDPSANRLLSGENRPGAGAAGHRIRRHQLRVGETGRMEVLLAEPSREWKSIGLGRPNVRVGIDPGGVTTNAPRF